MIRFYLLAIAVLLAVSGCAPQARPSGGQPEPARQAAAQAATDANSAATAPTEQAAQPAQAAPPDAVKPAEPAAKAQAEPQPRSPAAAMPDGASPQAAAGKSGDKQPEASPAAGRETAAPPVSGTQPTAASATAEQPKQASAPAPATAKNELKISITGDKKRGVILKELSVPFQEGTTVMDLLKQVTKDNKIQMEFQGKGNYAYVQGIDNLYEFDQGPKSGWVYKVNGRAPGEGAGSYKLSAGDKIEWLYTLNLGEDVGAVKK